MPQVATWNSIEILTHPAAQKLRVTRIAGSLAASAGTTEQAYMRLNTSGR
jgi:hypothetical protein